MEIMTPPPPGDADLEGQSLALDGPRYQPLEVGGLVLHAKVPQPNAVYAFTAAIEARKRQKVSDATQNDMISLFISQHLTPESFEAMMVRMLDPEVDDFSVKDLGAVLRGIVTLDTARPTVPSRT